MGSSAYVIMSIDVSSAGALQTSLSVNLTADLAIAAYGLAMWFALSPQANRYTLPTTVSHGPFFLSNTFYSVSVALMFVHVLLAYAISHHWSHQAAMEHAAVETEQTLGFEFAPGLYVNFVFLAVFIVDSVWRWRVKNPHVRKPLNAARGIDSFILFIFLMATLVFEAGPIRLFSAVGFIVIFARYLSWKRQQQSLC